MTDAEALELARRAVDQGRLHICRHGHDEGLNASAHPFDTQNAIKKATSCVRQPNGRWKVKGPDLDGEELTIILAVDPGDSTITVVTVW